jgi:signal transduction histidine kinase
MQFLTEDLGGSLGGEQLEYLNGMDKAVIQAENLVGDLLRLTRIGKEELRVEKIELGPFFDELIRSMNFPPEVSVETQETWPSVLAESALLRQVFTNLIGNAVKFNEFPDKRVRLASVDTGSQTVEISVADNGIGIEPKYHEKIFRIFERLHTASEYDGTGLGLAIVKKAVGRMSGRVRLESEPGKGSTFFVLLPRAEE